MPLDLYGAAGASDGTFSYHAGGYFFSSGNTLAVFNRYDPVANTWTPLADMPQAAIMASAVYYPTTNKIYVFGGEDALFGTNYNITRIYDIASNRWTTGANMPDVRSFMASGYDPANGKIYLVSGYNRGTPDSAQPDTWEYDPVANTFTSKTDFPHPAGGFASGLIDGHLYVTGGRDAANDSLNLVWDYDIAANTWTQKTDMPTPTTTPTPGGRTTPTPRPRPTPTGQCDSGIIQNGGFETGNFPPWVIGSSNRMPVVTNVRAHSGTFSGFAGGYPPDFCGYEDFRVDGVSWIYQEFTVPASGGTLSFWHWDCTASCGAGGYQDAYITDTNGTILQTIFHQCLNGQTWINQTVNLAQFAGQTVRIKFLVHEFFHFLTGMWVDDVQLTVPCASPTPTPTPRST